MSWTTRPKRSGEADGEHYHFVDEPTFRAALERDEFVEHESYRDNLYGTPWSEVTKATDDGRDILFEIDVRGAHSIKDRYPEAVAIFLAPPDPAVLAERLRGRGTDDPDQIQARLEAAQEELQQRDAFDHAVVNDEVRRAVEEIEGILGLSPHPSP